MPSIKSCISSPSVNSQSILKDWISGERERLSGFGRMNEDSGKKENEAVESLRNSGFIILILPPEPLKVVDTVLVSRVMKDARSFALLRISIFSSLNFCCFAYSKLKEKECW